MSLLRLFSVLHCGVFRFHAVWIIFLEVDHYFIQTDLHPVLEQLTTLEMSGPVHTGIVIHSYTQI